MFSKDNKFERVPGAASEKLSPEARRIVQEMLRLPQASLELADQFLGPQAKVIDQILEEQIKVEDEAA